jgi:hypothetical protein
MFNILDVMKAERPFPIALSFVLPILFKSILTQQVRNVLSADSCPINLIPVLRIQKHPLRIPNVHTTSLRIDSTQCEKQTTLTLLHEVFNSETVVGQYKYPLSTINQVPAYFFLTTYPRDSMSYSSNVQSCSVLPSLSGTAKLSKRTTVLLFHQAR